MNRQKVCILVNQLFSPFWCEPAWYPGSMDLSELPEQVQGGLILYEDGSYEAFLKNPGTADFAVPFFSGEDKDPYKALKIAAEKASEYYQVPLRENRSYPEIFEYLGWCSWDAMEIWANEEDLLTKCRELSEKRVPVRFAILDDMWADIEWTRKLPKFTDHSISFDVMHASKMKDYHADPERFPSGLKTCISAMKDCGPKTEGKPMEIGMWHPVTGYWAGLTKDGEAYEELSEYTVTLENKRIFPDFSDAEKVYGFYDQVYRFFRESGASFVKIDNQSCLKEQFSEICDPVTAAREMHEGLERAVSEWFSGNMINCMGMAYENMMNRPMSCISRCSDDFQPENKAWFTKHIKQCAYNSLFQGQFHVCDWDMWWTDDAQAKKNSILRALSGGPVYVSDRIGRTRPELLTSLCLEDGRILRCDSVLIPDRKNLMEDPAVRGKAFTVFNRADQVTYLASFNLSSEGSVQGEISSSDFGLSGTCALYEETTGAFRVLSSDEIYSFTLSSQDDYKVFACVSLSEQGNAVLGLKEKIVGIKAVQVTLEGAETEKCTVCPKTSGTLLYVKNGSLQEVPAKKDRKIELFH